MLSRKFCMYRAFHLCGEFTGCVLIYYSGHTDDKLKNLDTYKQVAGPYSVHLHVMLEAMQHEFSVLPGHICDKKQVWWDQSLWLHWNAFSACTFVFRRRLKWTIATLFMNEKEERYLKKWSGVSFHIYTCLESFNCEL